MEKSEEISKEVILNELAPGQKIDFAKIKQNIREQLGNYFNKETGSIPMIITVILEI